MCRQVGTHKTNGRIIKLQPYRDTTFVSHHTHDTNADRVTRHCLAPVSMGRLDKETHQQSHHTSLHNQGISLLILLLLLMHPARIVERGSQLIGPVLAFLLRLVVDGDIDSIQIDNLLKADADNVRSISAIGAPVFANPVIE
jgi:hypothetical protein